jgi:hypothetical protein
MNTSRHKFCDYQCQQVWHRRRYAAIRDWWKEQGEEIEFGQQVRSEQR